MHHVRTWLICLLLALTGCATTIEAPPSRLEMQQPKALRMVQEADRQAVAIQEPMQTMFDVEPVEDNVLATILEGFQSAEWLPYENGRAPPVNVAQVTTNPIVTGVCPPQFQGPTGVTGQVGNCEMPSFVAALQSSLIPGIAQGSPTATFTRATTAEHVDFEALRRIVPSGAASFQGARYVRNLVARSDVLAAAAGWTVTNATSVIGATDPLGGANAYTLTATAGNGIIYAVATVPAASTKLLNSIWIKRITGTGAVSIIRPINSAYVDISAQLTTSWKRFSLSGSDITAANGGTNAYHGIQIATNADSVAIYFPQTEDVTGVTLQVPSENVPSLATANADSGAVGVRYFSTLNGNTVASNVVTEATGAAINSAAAEAAGGVTAGVVDASGPLGYLAEGARTNRALYSQTWENAAWAATNVTKADNSAVAPDGTSTAATLTATAGNGIVIQDLGVVASASKTGGTWIKRKTGTGDIEVTMDGGTGWTAVTVTAAWTRVSKNQTLADEDFGIRIVTSGDAVYVWNGQVETGSFLSSDIPTTTVAVARNADVLTYASAGNISGTQGAAYAEVTISVGDATNYKTFITDSAAGGAPLAANLSNALYLYDLGGSRTFGITVTAGSVNKLATSWGGAVANAARNGTAGTSATFDGDLNLGATLQFGSNGAFATFGTIRNVRIYPTALPAARLTTITTDAVDWLRPENWAVAANDDYFRIAANGR